jgi:hypothetical protein
MNEFIYAFLIMIVFRILYNIKNEYYNPTANTTKIILQESDKIPIMNMIQQDNELEGSMELKIVPTNTGDVIIPGPTKDLVGEDSGYSLELERINPYSDDIYPAVDNLYGNKPMMDEYNSLYIERDYPIYVAYKNKYTKPPVMIEYEDIYNIK